MNVSEAHGEKSSNPHSGLGGGGQDLSGQQDSLLKQGDLGKRSPDSTGSHSSSTSFNLSTKDMEAHLVSSLHLV